jgi:hypothetical protein
VNRTRRRIDRVLVAIDASPGSLAAADSAARIASLLDAELVGLFVEDRALLRLSESPLARQVGPYGDRSDSRAGSSEVSRQLRAQALRSRVALARLAGRQNIAWSFRVVRGEVADEILSASSETDIVSLGRLGWALRQGQRLGSTARRLLGREGRITLFAARDLQPGRPVVVVHDGGEAGSEALELATRLVRGQPERLSILTGKASEAAARQEMERVFGNHATRARVTSREELSAEAAIRHATREGAGVLLLPATAVSGSDGLATLLCAVDCPVLVVS